MADSRRSEDLVAPISWRVIDRTSGASDWILLGDQPNDSYRIVVNAVGSYDGEVDAQVVYPCAVCHWDSACHGGEDCHS